MRWVTQGAVAGQGGRRRPARKNNTPPYAPRAVSRPPISEPGRRTCDDDTINRMCRSSTAIIMCHAQTAQQFPNRPTANHPLLYTCMARKPEWRPSTLTKPMPPRVLLASIWWWWWWCGGARTPNHTRTHARRHGRQVVVGGTPTHTHTRRHGRQVVVVLVGGGVEAGTVHGQRICDGVHFATPINDSAACWLHLHGRAW